VTLAARTLSRSPGFSSTVVLTLALGIGATTAIFTLVYSVAMRPLPVRGADRLVNVYQQFHGHFAREVNGFGSQISYPEFLAYSRNARALQSSAVYTQSDFASSDAPDGSVRGAYVSCGYFQTLQARIIIGRSFRSDECGQLGSPRVAVISYHLWQSQFGGDRSVIGRKLDDDDRPARAGCYYQSAASGVVRDSAPAESPIPGSHDDGHRHSCVLPQLSRGTPAGRCSRWTCRGAGTPARRDHMRQHHEPPPGTCDRATTGDCRSGSAWCDATTVDRATCCRKPSHRNGRRCR